MLKKSNKVVDILIKIWPYLAVCVLIFIVMNSLISISQKDFNIPIIYDGGDAAVTFYRSFEMGTDHSFFNFNQLGTPYGSNTYDFYVFDIGLFVIQFLFAALAPNFIVGFNLFIIAGAWFNGIASLYSLRRLKFAAPLSVVLSVIYASLPFFYFRYSNHTYLAYYFAAPLAICMAIELYRKEFVFSLKKEERKQTIINAILLFVIGTTGMYYAVFSCIYFLLVAILRGVEDLKIKSPLPALKAIGVTICGFIVGVIPPAVYWLRNGPGYLFQMRSGFIWAGEVFGAKLTELVLPNTGHRLLKLRNFRMGYVNVFGTTEAMTASLGIVFAAGLVLSFIYIFRIAKADKKSIMVPVSLLSIASILIVTPGGLGTFFAIILPFIRAYNRMSVYIAFLCAVAVAWFLTEFYEFFKKKIKNPIVLNVATIIFLGIFLAGGIYDETFPVGNNQPFYQTLYEEDKAFVDGIIDYSHSVDPDDKMVDVIFFPFMDFPENNQDTGERLYGYEPMNLCAMSEDLGMSFGAQRGREYADELQSVEELDMNGKIDWAIEHGFDGVVISYDAVKEMNPDDIFVLAKRFGDPDSYNVRYMYWSFEG